VSILSARRSNRVICSNNGMRLSVLGSKGFSRGVHYWEVQVEACTWGSVFIGVAPKVLPVIPSCCLSLAARVLMVGYTFVRRIPQTGTDTGSLTTGPHKNSETKRCTVHTSTRTIQLECCLTWNTAHLPLSRCVTSTLLPCDCIVSTS
jgi:hypothetical protein